jgi:hypothetical protein
MCRCKPGNPYPAIYKEFRRMQASLMASQCSGRVTRAAEVAFLDFARSREWHFQERDRRAQLAARAGTIRRAL